MYVFCGPQAHPALCLRLPALRSAWPPPSDPQSIAQKFYDHQHRSTQREPPECPYKAGPRPHSTGASVPLPCATLLLAFFAQEDHQYPSVKKCRAPPSLFGGAPDVTHAWHVDFAVWPDQAAVDELVARPEKPEFPSSIRTRVGKIDNPAGRPQTRVVVAPKGVFSPWEPLDRARRRDVYTGLVLKGLLSLGGILGRG